MIFEPNIIHFFEIMKEFERFHPDISQVRKSDTDRLLMFYLSLNPGGGGNIYLRVISVAKFCLVAKDKDINHPPS